jgi:glyoxylase-like metal-dependent hydrolase (beta-lactamase superfamily II)
MQPSPRGSELSDSVYSVELLLPTARFAFAVEGDHVEVLPEFRSPEGSLAYQQLRQQHTVVGMTTFPNTVLLRGELTIVVDPGLHLQNEPVLRALESRGLSSDDVDQILLTHAHLDHAGACADLLAPVTVHELECSSPHWAAVSGILGRVPLTRMRGEEGEVAPGITWARTPGHTDGGVSFCVTTADGPVVLCGDIVGPQRRDFDVMEPPADEPGAAELLASWRRLRAWSPALLIAGHVPPFRP